MRFFRLVCIVSGLAIFSIPAQSQDLRFTARAEAGIDPETRMFLASIPDIWRPQLARIVDDTMTRVDQSVAKYIEQLQRASVTLMAEAQCRTIMTSKEVIDDLVRRFPFVNQAGSMEKFYVEIDNAKARRKPDLEPRRVRAIYNDIMATASLFTCRPGSLPTHNSDVSRIIDEFTVRWMVWNRLEGLSCRTADDCAPAYWKFVETTIKDADKRDLRNADAEAQRQALKVPVRSGPWYWRGATDFDSIEQYLLAIYRIENSIGAAKAKREIEAIQKVNAARASIDESKGKITAIYSGVPKIRPVGLVIRPLSCDEQFEMARPQLTPLAQLLDKADGALKEALSISVIASEASSKEQERLKQQRLRIVSAASFCAPSAP